MAHYAFLDENNVVTEVIVGKDEDDLPKGVKSWEQYYGKIRNQKCLRTSYNTYGNAHRFGGEAFRGNFAGVGMIYEEELDVFIDPKPFASWTLNTNTFLWEAPVSRPTTGGPYIWSEGAEEWVVPSE